MNELLKKIRFEIYQAFNIAPMGIQYDGNLHNLDLLVDELESRISDMQKWFNNALHEIKRCWETPALFNGVEKDIIKTGICLDDIEKGLKQYSHGWFYEDLCFRLNSFYKPKKESESE